MSNFRELGEEIDRLLRLRTDSLGVKLFENEKAIPKDFKILEEPWEVCQVAGMARYHRQGYALTKDMATPCVVGAISLGFCDTPKEMKEGTANIGVYAKTKEAVKKMFSERPCIERGKFEAVGFIPLKQSPVEPDTIMVYCTPFQALCFIYATKWDGGENLELNTSGHGGCCYEALAVPFITGKIRLAIADIGERRFARVEEYEMLVGFPINQLERLVNNLRELNKGIFGYPNPWPIYHLPKAVIERGGIKKII